MKIEFIKTNELENQSIILINKLDIYIFFKLFFLGNKNLIILISKPSSKVVVKILFFFKFNIKLFDLNLLKLEDKDKAHKLSYEVSDYFNEKKIPSNISLINFLKSLYKNNQVLSIYNKYLSLETYYFFYVNIFCDYIYEKNKNLIFISDMKYNQSFEVLKKTRNNNYSKSFKTLKPLSYYLIKNIIYRVFYISILFTLPIILILKFRLRMKKIEKFIMAIRLYNNGYRLNKNSKTIDWLIDDHNFSRNNSLFISENKLDKKFKIDLFNSNYEYLELDNFNFKIFIKNFNIFNHIKIIFKNFLFYSNKIIFYDNIDLKFLILSLLTYHKWDTFLNFYKIKIFISYQDYSIQSLLRNLIFNNKNCKSILYKSTYSEGIFSNDYLKHRLITYSCANYNHEFHWGYKSVEFSKSCGGLSKNYTFLKPFWSFKNNQYNTGFDRSLIKIAFFSSSFNLHSINTNNDKDHLQFLKSIELLLKYNNIKVYYKSKSPYKNYELSNNLDLQNLSEKLRKNHNFEVIDNNYSSIKLINETQLSISMSFASTTLEAICMGKKSFYFDGNNKFANADFNVIPNFVCTDPQTIGVYFDYWYHLNNDQFLKFYNDNFKKEFGKLNFYDNPMTIIRSKLKEIIDFTCN